MSTNNRKQREALKRRSDILQAARDIFMQKGYSGTTISAIAKGAELATGTIYLYFESKDALYVELLTEGYELLVEYLERGVNASSDPKTAAGETIDAFFDFARDHKPYFDILFFVLQLEQATDWNTSFPEAQAKRLTAWETKARSTVESVLQQAAPVAEEKREDRLNATWAMLAGVVFHFGWQESFPAVAAETKSLLMKALFA
jgi:AcrR family transcriptional regulator